MEDYIAEEATEYEESTEELMEDDEISPEEEAFMKGYDEDAKNSEDEEDLEDTE